VRNGYASAAIGTVILAFRQTRKFVENEAGGYDSDRPTSPEPQPMQPSAIPTPHLPASPGATPLPSGEPYRLQLAGGRLQGVFDITTVADAEEVIRAINAWKVLVRPLSEIKKPGNDEAAD
jgi:hypothetical protein